MSDQPSRNGSGSRGGDDGELPAELRDLHRRLLRDGASWRGVVPPNERLNARVRTLPLEMPQVALSTNDAATRTSDAIETAPHASESRMPWADHGRDVRDGRAGARGDEMRNRISGTNAAMRTIGAWAGGAAAVAVVALLATLLVHMASGAPGGQSGQQIGSGTGTSTPQLTPTVTPFSGATDTPTIGSKYVTSAVTAKGIDANFNPVNPTGFFKVGERVYVILQVRSSPAGQHRLSIEWFLNGQPVNLPATEQTSRAVTGSTNAYFALNYPQAGRGTARIYWDLPPGISDSQADAYLAQVVAFEVQDPNAATPTVVPSGPTSTPPATPTPGH